MREGVSYEIMRSRIKEVGAVSEAVAQAERAIKSGAGFGTVLSALAQLDDQTIQKSTELIELYSDCLRRTLSEVSEKLQDAPPSPDEISSTLLTGLDSLEQTWTEISEELNP
jgi:hypothetical protein